MYFASTLGWIKGKPLLFVGTGPASVAMQKIIMRGLSRSVDFVSRDSSAHPAGFSSSQQSRLAVCPPAQTGFTEPRSRRPTAFAHASAIEKGQVLFWWFRQLSFAPPKQIFSRRAGFCRFFMFQNLLGLFHRHRLNCFFCTSLDDGSRPAHINDMFSRHSLTFTTLNN